MNKTAQEGKKSGNRFGLLKGVNPRGRRPNSILLRKKAGGQKLTCINSNRLEHAKAVIRMCSIAFVVSLAACAQQQLDQFSRDMANLNAALAGGTASGGRPAGTPGSQPQNSDAPRGASTQLVVPADKTAAAALDAALPTIKKVVSLHQCMKDPSEARLFSPYAVPGGENNVFSYGFYRYAPIYASKYHDKNRCVSVRAIDQVTLLALNSLQARVVYLAEDSGEASSFQMQFMKAADGSWRVLRISPLE